MQVGDKVTTRVDGKIRGCRVLSIEDDTVYLVTWTPTTQRIQKSRDQVQRSDKWNDPQTRRAL